MYTEENTGVFVYGPRERLRALPAHPFFLSSSDIIGKVPGRCTVMHKGPVCARRSQTFERNLRNLSYSWNMGVDHAPERNHTQHETRKIILQGLRFSERATRYDSCRRYEDSVRFAVKANCWIVACVRLLGTYTRKKKVNTYILVLWSSR